MGDAILKPVTNSIDKSSGLKLDHILESKGSTFTQSTIANVKDEKYESNQEIDPILIVENRGVDLSQRERE